MTSAPAPSAWPAGPVAPHIEPGEVHLWLADLGDVSAGRAALRERSRTILHTLLGRYLGRGPGELRLERSGHGKPSLQGPLRFNLAHSGRLALYGFCSGGEIGVDLECDRPRALDEVALARRLFGEEEALRIAALAPEHRRTELLRGWVRVEATLKWQGGGFAGAGAAGGGPHPWIEELETVEGAHAALALDGPPGRLERWRNPIPRVP